MVHKIVICSLYISPIALAQYAPSPRWAQAVALLESTLYVHGGLSDPFNSYSYTSAPGVSDLLVLDLSAPFNSSSPPWQLFPSNASSALAWHTLSAFNTTELLSFGGQPGPESSTVLTTRNDSCVLLLASNKSSSSFLTEPQNWANQPMRRIRHSASYTSGKVWIIGGEKADGSGNAFSEHYSFIPSGPEFVQLPSSSSAPPDIYGHASLVLPDGLLLVLGGYCASCSELIPMDTVWSLNTTQNPLVWGKLSISSTSLPNPRRDFAAVVLSNGQVLIHGGGDAQLQETYSDGWILDTSQNPMVWNSVAALTQIGQRKDHFAVQAGGFVLFGFGYGSSSPVSASLFIYSPAASSMVASYVAPSPGSTPAIPSLPMPTQTSSNPNSDGGTGTTPGGSSGSPPYTSGSSSASNRHTIAIALGTTFGTLALVACVLATIYCRKRPHNRKRRASRSFFLLADDPEFSPSERPIGSPAPEAAHCDGQITEKVGGTDSPSVITGILARLGINKFSSRLRQPRKDMFADEDTRSFGWAGYSTIGQGQGSEGTSDWSRRSVSALVREMTSREPSGSGTDSGNHKWEKIDHLRNGGREDLIRQRSFHSEYVSHPTHQRDGSFCSHTDPCEDPLPDDGYDDLGLRPGTEKDADYDDSLPTTDETDDFESTALAPQHSIWSFSVRSRTLIPLREDSFSDPFSSPVVRPKPSHGKTFFDRAANAALSPPPSLSLTLQSPTASCLSDLPTVTSAPRYSTASGSTLSRSPTLSRPDSWWSRMTKSPLLDRRASITSSKHLDFRDPTPAPPLIPLDEARTASFLPACSDDIPTDILAGHSKSLSSAHSGRTANTDSAEHLGGSYDVVQRLASDGSSSRRVLSLGSAEATEQGMIVTGNHAVAAIPPTGGLHHADPPGLTSVLADPFMSMGAETQCESLVPPKPIPTSSETGGIVANRVRAYERKLFQETESQQRALPRNADCHEEVSSRTRPTMRYGVVPRPSLYIANPDLAMHIS